MPTLAVSPVPAASRSAICWPSDCNEVLRRNEFPTSKARGPILYSAPGASTIKFRSFRNVADVSDGVALAGCPGGADGRPR
jgi:hypothetical protein